MRGTPRGDVKVEVDRALRSVRLDGFGGRYPKELSGGQQQRVALARAIAPRPSVLLLDEPLSNLDLKLREAMRIELKEIHETLGMTFVYVTHDQEEAMAMSDRIVVMDRGAIAQQGSPGAIYRNPASRFVADFMGRSNILAVSACSRSAAGIELSIEGSSIVLKAAHGAADGSVVSFCSVRPECLTLVVAAEVPSGMNRLEGTIRRTIDLGAHAELEVVVEGGHRLVLHRPARAIACSYTAGQAVTICVDPADVRPLPL
jgi:putative spermidine/putrescine transport system ATP-binding protein/spermidine/putrescine transport system ATP-binding protein